MSTRMEINGSETGTVRVFHLDLPREAVDRFAAQAGTGEWALQSALGADRLRPAFVEVVDLRDLGEMPLSTYLAEAYGVQGTDFNAAKPQLDALSGHVVILPSQAFDQTGQTLNVSAPLRWVGTFSEAPARKPTGPLRSEAAKPSAGTPAPAPHGGGSTILRVTLAVLAAIVVAVLLLIAF